MGAFGEKLGFSFCRASSAASKTRMIASGAKLARPQPNPEFVLRGSDDNDLIHPVELSPSGRWGGA